MKTSIVIVTYQSSRYIVPLLESIARQTLPPHEVIVVDNASSDDTLALAHQTLPTARIFPQKENLWFSKGYNIGIRESHGDWILVCNHDIVLEPTFLEHLSRGQILTARVGSLCGKLLKMEKAADGRLLIDSCGIQVLRSRRMIDRGEGEKRSRAVRKHAPGVWWFRRPGVLPPRGIGGSRSSAPGRPL